MKDVDALEAEPLEAFLDRAHDPVVAEVEHRVDRWSASEGLAWLGRDVCAQESPDLRGEGEVVARFVLERFSDPDLCKAMPVQGRGVEGADARIPGPLDDGYAFGLFDRLEEARKRGRAQAEASDRQAGSPEGNALAGIQLRRVT